MRKFALTVLLSGALCACAAVPAAVSALSSIHTTSKTVTLDGTIALTIAADAYTGVASLVTAAVNHGAFNADQLRRIRDLNDQASLLVGEHAGVKLTPAQRASKLYVIVAEFHKILGS